MINRAEDIFNEIGVKELDLKNLQNEYVYFLFFNDLLLYIGKAAVLQSRIQQHRKTRIFNKVLYIEVGEGQSAKLEEDMILKYKPPCNGALLRKTEKYKDKNGDHVLFIIGYLIFTNLFGNIRNFLMFNGKIYNAEKNVVGFHNDKRFAFADPIVKINREKEKAFIRSWHTCDLNNGNTSFEKHSQAMRSHNEFKYDFDKNKYLGVGNPIKSETIKWNAASSRKRYKYDYRPTN